MRRFHVDPEVGPLVVAALGGNAVCRRCAELDFDAQRADAKRAAATLAELARRHRIVVTHGEGPQVGVLSRESSAFRDDRAYPLDVLGAETEGVISYLLEQELSNELPDRPVVSLMTRVVVDALDPAFRAPSTRIGPAFDQTVADHLAKEHGWNVAANNDGWRRVVASPVPRSIVELATIELLLAEGVLVIAAGGGGIPVVVDVQGARHPVEAVVDKDWAAAVLARQLGAQTLLLLTDVAAVMQDWGTPTERPIERITPAELSDQQFAPSSMGPKVDAAVWFASTTGGRAVIGLLDDTEALLQGKAGTTIEGRRELSSA
jgi:carbamate kinase